MPERHLAHQPRLRVGFVLGRCLPALTFAPEARLYVACALHSAQDGGARVQPGTRGTGAVLEPRAAVHWARSAHLRGLRQESGGPSPCGQGEQASELRGGARASPHRPPQGLAVAAHREPGRGAPHRGANCGGCFPPQVHAGHLPRLPGRPGGPETPRQPGGHLCAGPEAAARTQVLLPRGLQ